MTPPFTPPSVPRGPLSFYSSVLAAPAANFDVLTIPQGYDVLELFLHAHSSDAAAAVAANIAFNNDTNAGHYFYEFFAGIDAAATAVNVGDTAVIGRMPADGDVAARTCAIYVAIPGYSNATLNKTYTATCCMIAANSQSLHTAGLWNATEAITRVTITPSGGSFVAGSRLTGRLS